MEEEKSGEVMRVIDRGTGIEMVIPVEYYNPAVHDMPPDDEEEPAEEPAEEPVGEPADEHGEEHGGGNVWSLTSDDIANSRDS